MTRRARQVVLLTLPSSPLISDVDGTGVTTVVLAGAGALVGERVTWATGVDPRRRPVCVADLSGKAAGELPLTKRRV